MESQPSSTTRPELSSGFPCSTCYSWNTFDQVKTTHPEQAEAVAWLLCESCRTACQYSGRIARWLHLHPDTDHMQPEEADDFRQNLPEYWPTWTGLMTVWALTEAAVAQ